MTNTKLNKLTDTFDLYNVYDFYLNDALYGYNEGFNNEIKTIIPKFMVNELTIKLVDYNGNFVEFYADKFNRNRLVITTNVFGQTMQTILEDYTYYSGRGYTANISPYSFIQLFKFYNFKQAFNALKTYDSEEVL